MLPIQCGIGCYLQPDPAASTDALLLAGGQDNHCTTSLTTCSTPSFVCVASSSSQLSSSLSKRLAPSTKKKSRGCKRACSPCKAAQSKCSGTFLDFPGALLRAHAGLTWILKYKVMSIQRTCRQCGCQQVCTKGWTPMQVQDMAFHVLFKECTLITGSACLRLQNLTLVLGLPFTISKAASASCTVLGSPACRRK